MNYIPPFPDLLLIVRVVKALNLFLGRINFHNFALVGFKPFPLLNEPSCENATIL